MRNELLNHLQLDDLKGETHELAETIGLDAFRRELRQAPIDGQVSLFDVPETE